MSNKPLVNDYLAAYLEEHGWTISSMLGDYVSLYSPEGGTIRAPWPAALVLAAATIEQDEIRRAGHIHVGPFTYIGAGAQERAGEQDVAQLTSALIAMGVDIAPVYNTDAAEYGEAPPAWRASGYTWAEFERASLRELTHAIVAERQAAGEPAPSPMPLPDRMMAKEAADLSLKVLTQHGPEMADMINAVEAQDGAVSFAVLREPDDDAGWRPAWKLDGPRRTETLDSLDALYRAIRRNFQIAPWEDAEWDQITPEYQERLHVALDAYEQTHGSAPALRLTEDWQIAARIDDGRPEARQPVTTAATALGAVIHMISWVQLETRCPGHPLNPKQAHKLRQAQRDGLAGLDAMVKRGTADYKWNIAGKWTGDPAEIEEAIRKARGLTKAELP